MRIAILADPLDNQYAGIHIYTKELIRALIHVDKANEYILIRQKRDNDFPELKQIIVPNLPLYTGFQIFRFFLIFPIIAQRLKVDAVVEPAHFGPFNLPKKIKRITVIHDLTPIKFPELHRYYSQTLQRVFLKKILKKADLIITNSNNTSQDVIEFLPGSEEKVKRIYLGKEKLFKPCKQEKTIEKYNLNKPYFLFTGTLEPRKNILVLLSAFDAFRNLTNLNVKLIIVGKKGWKSEPVMDALKNHPYKNDIQLLGYVPRQDLPTLYTNAIAFIYPSIYEGFGLPVLEAMACGTPCILSNSSSLPEVGGDAALYFNVHNTSELAEKMKILVEDINLRKEMKQKSLIQASRFSWDLYAMEFSKTIEKLK
ncbi:MAG: glycosyltransferase family 4 protein [Bacteroidales bacterium]|nr:glycosyltransferase family 4 protein [Bacteroidales bacterium]